MAADSISINSTSRAAAQHLCSSIASAVFRICGQWYWSPHQDQNRVPRYQFLPAADLGKRCTPDGPVVNAIMYALRHELQTAVNVEACKTAGQVQLVCPFDL